MKMPARKREKTSFPYITNVMTGTSHQAVPPQFTPDRTPSKGRECFIAPGACGFKVGLKQIQRHPPLCAVRGPKSAPCPEWAMTGHQGEPDTEMGKRRHLPGHFQLLLSGPGCTTPRETQELLSDSSRDAVLLTYKARLCCQSF